MLSPEKSSLRNLNVPPNAFPVWFAYVRFKEFTGGIAREFGNEIYRTRLFVGRESFAAKGDQFLGGGAGCGPQLDHSLYRLAPIFIGNADYGHIGNGRVRGQHRFDLSWIDVDPTGNDHVDSAITDIVVALIVAIGDITD